jgi:signal transduction histidine kinase
MKIFNLFSNLYWNFYDKKFLFLVAVFSILLNWAGYFFVYENSYNFLYFDMVGTFVATIVLGSLWGIIVAFASTILLSVSTYPHFIYLAVVNIVGALYWGILSECGIFTIFKSNNLEQKCSIKSNFNKAVSFLLFYGVGAGLLTAFFSSIIRNTIFENILVDKPYSLFFSHLFKNLFNFSSSGINTIFINYIADTFIEIPDKIIDVLFGLTICLTIFKFNIYTLTNAYQKQIYKIDIPWHKITLTRFSSTEIYLFFILIIIYILKIKTTSLKLLEGFINNLSLYSLQDYVFLEILSFPIFIFVIFLMLKLFSTSSYKYLQFTLKYNLDIKTINKDSKYFLIDIFFISSILVITYLFILIVITGITPVAYYNTISLVKAKPELLLWLLATVCTFILIDQRNNRITASVTLNNELIKKQTSEQIFEAFDEQKQKLQVLELNWSDNTLEFLKSARHDLINDLEKSKTRLNELLTEVYDNVVKPYSNLILKNQKEIREYIEELSNGDLKIYYLQDIIKKLENTISILQLKAPYIKVRIIKTKKTDIYCKINKLFFIAFNNILDNSVYALQKHVLNNNFTATINIVLKIKNDKFISLSILDNAGGLPKNKISKIYKSSIESSKGNRLGEGTIIASNFIKVLGGFIYAKNIKFRKMNGLETVINIPYFIKDFSVGEKDE